MGFSSLFIAGDIVSQNPKESTSVFCSVVILSIMLEKGFFMLKHHRSRFVRMMFCALMSELMTVGMIALIVVLVSDTVTVTERVHLLFEWCHFVLLFMLAFYIFLNVMTIMVIRFANRRWMDWETHLPAVDDMQNAPEEGHARQMYLARLIFKEQVRRKDPRDTYADVRFTSYLERMEKVNMVKLAELRWVTWLALGFLFVINSIRQYFMPINVNNPSLEDRIWNIVTFIVLLGWLPLGIFIVVAVMVSKGFTAFITSLGMNSPEAMKKLSVDHVAQFVNKMGDPSQYLIRGDMDVTLILLQIFTLAQELYLGMFFMGFAYDLAERIKLWYLLLAPLAFFPVIIFHLVVPWVMYTLSVLTSLGPHLCMKLVENLAKNPRADMPLMEHDEDDNEDEHDDEAHGEGHRPIGSRDSVGVSETLLGGWGGSETDRQSSGGRTPRSSGGRTPRSSRGSRHGGDIIQQLRAELKKLGEKSHSQKLTIRARDETIALITEKIDRYNAISHRQKVEALTVPGRIVSLE